MEPYWNLIEQIVRESDIILEILDARLVEQSRNRQLEEIINRIKRPRIFVVNKSDLVEKKELEKKIENLSREGEVVYVTQKDKKTIKILISKIKQVFSKYGKRQDFKSIMIKKPYREAKGDVVIGIVGYPNVGKSSIINSLSFKKKMKVSKKAGTTHGIHWIKASDNIKLIDTPGVIPLGYEEEVKLGLMAAKSAEKIKEPELVAGKIIQMFLDKNIRRLEEFYSINLGKDEKDPYVIINLIALKKGHLKRHAEADEARASQMIIRDWQEGKLRL